MSVPLRPARVYFIFKDENAIAKQIETWLTNKYPLLDVIPLTTTSPGAEAAIGLGDVVVALLEEEGSARQYPLPEHPIWTQLDKWSNGKDSVPVVPVSLSGISAAAPRLPQSELVPKFKPTCVHYKIDAEESSLKMLGKFVGKICGLAGANIFISYARSDGASTAEAINGFLRKNGFDVFIDRAPEEELRQGDYFVNNLKGPLDDCNCLLLIDTEDTNRLRNDYKANKDTSWVDRELMYAYARQVPILQVICRHVSESSNVSRFAELNPLQPVAPLKRESYEDAVPPEALLDVLDKLKEIMKRALEHRRGVPQNAERQFRKENYTWNEIDFKKQMYGSEKEVVLENGERILSKITFRTPRFEPDRKTFLKQTQNHAGRGFNRCFFIHGEDDAMYPAEAEELALESRFGGNRKIIHWTNIMKYIR